MPPSLIKILLLFPFLTYLHLPLIAADDTSLQEAISKKLVQVKIKGKGCYRGECLEIVVTNKSSYRLNLAVEPGSIFLSDNDWVQDLIVVKRLAFKLNPNATASFVLETMCTQLKNAGPDTDELYHLGTLAKGYLLQLTKLIDAENYQTSTAQSAVWAITDGNSIGEIYGQDTTMVKELCKVVSEATGQPCTGKNLQPRNHSITSIKTSLECLIPDYAENLSLTMYDENGNRIRSYFSEKDLQPGFYQFKIGMNHTLGDSARFNLKLETTARIISEKQVVISDTIIKLQEMKTEQFVTYELPEDTKASVGVYDENDQLYILLADHKLLPKGFNKSIFQSGRSLPFGKKYFLKVKADGKTIVAQEFHLEADDAKRYAPIVKRGILKCQLKAPVEGAKLAVYDENNQIIWVVFENSYLGHGYKNLQYVFKHQKGPEAAFKVKLSDKEGNIIKEDCINCQ
ncbi:hypothetical protein [Flexithrix dorotheae]|uniref:hypothetical protein n=1 Tax=Flexithrix dorotheae TaxID=70993 RepID=UPI000365F247|nr:hypothetical protein [Flexithrix dorotheae]